MADRLCSLYPLRFHEILRNYGFGNRWIVAEFAKPGLAVLAGPEHRVAETWEVVDRPAESSVIANGPLVGATLHDLIAQQGEALLGRDVVRRFGTRFPLLIKFLDASNPLGEQCHPTDAQAEALQRNGDPGKTEAWYMLRTRPRATVRVGSRPGVDRAGLIEALMAGTARDCMAETPVKPGDGFLLYAGTMHYAAGGVLFYEIMQNSDITIGLRALPGELSPEQKLARARELSAFVHLEDDFDCHTQPVSVTEGPNRRTFIFACRYFALEKLDLVEAWALDMQGDRFCVLSNVAGTCDVVYGEARERLGSGQSCLLPADLGPVRIAPRDGPAEVLNAYVPDLMRDVVIPLRAHGVSDDSLRGLGGRTRLNDLAGVL